MEKKATGLFTNNEIMSIERIILGPTGDGRYGLIGRGNIHVQHATNRNLDSARSALKPVRKRFQEEAAVKYHLDMQGYTEGIQKVLDAAEGENVILVQRLDATPKLQEFKAMLMDVEDIKAIIKLGDEGEEDKELLESALASVVEMCDQELSSFDAALSDEGAEKLAEIMGELNPSFVPFKYNPDKVPETLGKEEDLKKDIEKMDMIFSMLMSDLDRTEPVS